MNNIYGDAYQAVSQRPEGWVDQNPERQLRNRLVYVRAMFSRAEETNMIYRYNRADIGPHACRATARLIAQQGTFTLGTSLWANHTVGLAQALASFSESEADWSLLFGRIKVPAESKPEILRKLSRMNITPTTLFPGIDGHARAMAGIVDTLGPTYFAAQLANEAKNAAAKEAFEREKEKTDLAES
jgi:hypothetical protein